MRPIFLLLLFLSFYLNSCLDKKVVNYYDKNSKRKQSQGYINDSGQCHGLWQYFDTLGNIIEYGNFINGLRVNKWTYKISNNDTSVFWNTVKSDKFSLSLPNNNCNVQISSDTSCYVTFGTQQIFIQDLSGLSVSDSNIIDIFFQNDTVCIKYFVEKVLLKDGSFFYNFKSIRDKNTLVFQVLLISGKHKNLVIVNFPNKETHFNFFNTIFTEILGGIHINDMPIFQEKGEIVDIIKLPSRASN